MCKTFINKILPRALMVILVAQYVVLPLTIPFWARGLDTVTKILVFGSGLLYLYGLSGCDEPKYPVASAEQARASKIAQDKFFNEPK